MRLNIGHDSDVPQAMVSVGSKLGLWHNIAKTKKAIFARFGEHAAHVNRRPSVMQNVVRRVGAQRRDVEAAFQNQMMPETYRQPAD
jgi:hypothetical protein